MCLSMCLQGGSRQVTTGSFCEKNSVVSNFPHSPIGSIHKHRKKSACGAGSWNFPLKKNTFFGGGDITCVTHRVRLPTFRIPAFQLFVVMNMFHDEELVGSQDLMGFSSISRQTWYKSYNSQLQAVWKGIHFSWDNRSLRRSISWGIN